MPSLMRMICDTSKDSGVRSDCLWVVKELACSVWQMLVASSEQAYQVLHICMADPTDTVKAEAGAMLISLIDNIETKEERKPFATLIPEVSAVMAHLAASADSKQLNTLLQSLQSTTEVADFFKSHIGSHILPVLCGIAKSHKDEAARKYAFEAILCFLEGKTKAMLKVPNFVEQARVH
ncbi:unnamed protein product [Polarella glacialis]|uniref:HEAT repeat-containing protein 1 n=1 Tax=Polarella glacialis TaxID=89957 RepID=A0A813GKW6_POLGL|nr:unnamed protein product [Polarella glacialis]